MLADQCFELADELGCAAEREVGLDPLLDCYETELFEPADLGLRERLVGEVGERRPMPQGKRFAKGLRGARRIARCELTRPVGEQRPEAASIEVVRLELEDVPGRARDEATAELLAEVRDVDVKQVMCALGRRLAPQLIGQSFDRNDFAKAEHENREQRPWPRAAEIEATTVHSYLERPENPNV